ncbi:9519_t:CDS:2, partial [Scutellospora calospora]
FTDGTGFAIEPPHNPVNNYTSQEFNAIRSDVNKLNCEAQMKALLRFQVKQNKLKRLEFHNTIKDEYGDVEKKIKERHDELELLKLFGFNIKEKNLDKLINENDELIKKDKVEESTNKRNQDIVTIAEILKYDKKAYDEYCSKYELDQKLRKLSQQGQYERLKKLHSFIMGKVEAIQSSSPVTSISDNSLYMKTTNEENKQQNSTVEQTSKIMVDQKSDINISNNSIKNNDDSSQPNILSKSTSISIKFNQRKFTAKKDIFSMECIPNKPSSQSNQSGIKDKTDPNDSPTSSSDKSRNTNLSDYKHFSNSYSISTPWRGRSKYPYSYIPNRSRTIIDRNQDYSIFSYRRSIKPSRPFKKLRSPYDNKYPRLFSTFRSEIKSFSPSYSQNRVWKNDYSDSKFSRHYSSYSRDKDSTSTVDNS